MVRNLQYYKFSLYGFLKNLKFYESFLILFFLEKGVDYLKIGALYSIREITVVLFEVPSGLAADAMGRKNTMISAFFLYIISFVLFYFSQLYWVMVVAMVFYALADALRSGVHKAMIFQYLKLTHQDGQKAEYYGHTRSWSQTGSAISALVAAGVVFYTGNYKIIFAASIIPYLMDMLLIWSYPSVLNGEQTTLQLQSLSGKFNAVFSAFVDSFKHLLMFKSLTSLSLHTGYYKAVKDYIQPAILAFALSLPFLTKMQEKQKTALLVGLFYFFIYLLTAWTSRHAGRFQKVFNEYARPLNVSIVFGITAGLLAGLFFFLHGYWAAILGFVAIMMTENLRKPIGVAYIADQAHDEAMTSILSVQSQLQSLFAAVIAFFTGWAANQLGPGLGIALSSFLLLGLGPLFWLKQKNL